jgi:hypothetical protein
MTKFIQNLNKHFYIFIFFLAALYYYALLFVFDVKTDIQLHVGVVSDIVEGRDFPPNFLYFAAVYVAALFQNNYQSLLYGSLIVISLAIAHRFFVTARLFAAEVDPENRFGENKIQLLSNLIGFCLITAFCFYLPKELGLTKYAYLGQIPPNVWHNSTTIALIPFAFLLYRQSYKLLEKFDLKNLYWIIGLVVLNNLIKPSFFLCFAAVFPLMALMRYKLKKEFFLSLIPVVLGFVLIVLEYIAIYQLGKSSIAVEPFAWWRIYAENIPVSILISVAFPLAYLVFYFKRVKNETFLYYAYLLFSVAIIILALFVEKGHRESDGNFFWQTTACNYILFSAVATDFARNLLREGKLNVKDMIIAGVFALHVVSGWLYLAKTLFRANYG